MAEDLVVLHLPDGSVELVLSRVADAFTRLDSMDADALGSESAIARTVWSRLVYGQADPPPHAGRAGTLLALAKSGDTSHAEAAYSLAASYDLLERAVVEVALRDAFFWPHCAKESDPSLVRGLVYDLDAHLNSPCPVDFAAATCAEATMLARLGHPEEARSYLDTLAEALGTDMSWAWGEAELRKAGAAHAEGPAVGQTEQLGRPSQTPRRPRRA
jgi:hypothetical protein